MVGLSELSIDILEENITRAGYFNTCASNSSAEYFLIVEPGLHCIARELDGTHAGTGAT